MERETGVETEMRETEVVIEMRGAGVVKLAETGEEGETDLVLV